MNIDIGVSINSSKGLGAEPEPPEFITTWDSNFGSTPSNQIKISVGAGTFDYDIDWGDSNSDSNVTGDITHTYAAPGVYTITITGTFPSMFFDTSGDDQQKLRTIEKWGTNPWETMFAAFRASPLVINATDTPDLSNVTSTESMFENCSQVNVGLDNWNMSNVTNARLMFKYASSFNGEIDGWDVSNITDMYEMFYGSASFNRSLNSWDTSSVTDMGRMLGECFAFNGNIGDWDVSNVTDMNNMFLFDFVFNQDLSNWDISAATTLASMLKGSAFNTTNYDLLLTAWSALTVQSGVSFTDVPAAYSASVQSNRDTLTNAPNSWTITDGGVA